MRKKLCPQCKIASFYLKNDANDRLLIYVNSDDQILLKYPEDSFDGFNQEEIFCLGCSWHGLPKRTVKYWYFIILYVIYIQYYH